MLPDVSHHSLSKQSSSVIQPGSGVVVVVVVEGKGVDPTHRTFPGQSHTGPTGYWYLETCIYLVIDIMINGYGIK